MTDADNIVDFLTDLLARTRRAGADAADAMLVESSGESASWRLGKLENVERAESADLGLRVFVGRRQAIVSTGDRARPSLERLVERALAIARAVPEDPHAGLAEPDRIARDYPVLDLDDGQEPETDALARQAAVAEEAALAHPKITNSEGAAARWSRVRTTLVATNGFVGSSARSSHSIGAAVIAGANGAMERDYEYRTVVRARDLPDPAEIGRKAAARAAARLNPRKSQSKAVPIVFDPRVAGSMVRHLTSAISGPTVARGTTFLKDGLGQAVFAAGVSIVDDPLRPEGLRSRAFDAEGVGTERRRLVDQGVLATWLLDCASARQLGLSTTAHAVRDVSSAPSPAPTNAWIEPGGMTPDELISDIKEGLYVTEMLGMGVNMVTGDYSRGAAGFWIEDGRIGWPIAEVTIAGNLADMFARLTPASDLEFRYGIDAPTLRIDGMTVAGQ
ncbi:MAG TPA: metallopeptidase TldD-related protein [Geminicoccaceae bacterium]|jgi:PmbA protein|nr:metallopeptidase TldD-related protein [Geminicoccaceae bacterium]